MKVYEAVFDENRSEGVYALSVVENPAMEDMWIALSEHPKKIELSTIDEEKRLLLGAALIPNKKIYRNINGNEFYITFSENTIEKLAHSFFKKQYNNNSNLEHDVKLNGMSVVEGWIVDNPDKDKSNEYGKRYEKGTWVTMMKVDNDDVWNQVKTGQIKGFSIDALLDLKPLELSTNFNTNIKMTEEIQKNIVKDVIDGFKTFFNSNKEEEKEKAEAVLLAQQKEKEETEKVLLAQQEAKKQEIEKIKEEVLSDFKSQLEVALSEKDKEIEVLKAELSKQPESNGVKPKGEVQTEVKLNKDGKILQAIRNAK